MQISKGIRIIFLMILIVVFGSVSHISLPLVVTYYPSVFFVLFMTPIEGIIIYGLIIIGRKIYDRFAKREDPIERFAMIRSHWRIILPTGMSNASMCISMMYAANPVRTPVVIQAVSLGLAVLFSIVLSKMFLRKVIVYNYPYMIISILFLLGSVLIATVPLMMDARVLDSNLTVTSFVQNNSNIGWILLFIFGVFSFSLTNVLQEKYIRDSEDDSFNNKIYMAFSSTIVQLITILLFSWLDLFLGYESTLTLSFRTFAESFHTMISDVIAFFTLQIFMLLWFLLFVMALFLNEISTNYTMILTNITNQSVALFFTIFPHLNEGIQYPLFVTLSSMATSFVSVLFWINAEKVIDDDADEEEIKSLQVR